MVLKDPSSIRSLSEDGKTPLMFAAAEGNIASINSLIAVDNSSECINYQNSIGNSALHYAVWNGHDECTRHLIEECGADPMLTNKDGMTPIQFAAAANHIGLLDYLSSSVNNAVSSTSVSGLNNLHRACMHGSMEVVMLLVNKQNMDPNTPATGTGNTPLHLAAQGGYNDIVTFLLNQANIKFNSQNNHGLTALHFACNGYILCYITSTICIV